MTMMTSTALQAFPLNGISCWAQYGHLAVIPLSRLVCSKASQNRSSITKSSKERPTASSLCVVVVVAVAGLQVFLSFQSSKQCHLIDKRKLVCLETTPLFGRTRNELSSKKHNHG